MPDDLFQQGERRPDPRLLMYYFLGSCLLGPLFIFLLVPRLMRYRTLRYTFDEEGVSMRWGLLFRREISLNYARLQDIHLTSNAVERWLSLGKVQLQTASGSADAEMTIEGLPDFEQVRDFLYSRMRGARRRRSAPAAPAPYCSPVGLAEVTASLRAVSRELAAVRALLENPPGEPAAEAPPPAEALEA